MYVSRQKLQTALVSGALAVGMCVCPQLTGAQDRPQDRQDQGQFRITIPFGNNGFFQVGNWRETRRYTGDMSRQIHMVLSTLPGYNMFDNLQFQVDRDGDKVTLYGQVTSERLSEQAEEAVGNIDGVNFVDNQIQVLPNDPRDQRLRYQIKNALYGYREYEGYQDNRWQREMRESNPPIHVIVDHGNVTLFGVVDSYRDREQAEERVENLPGVQNLDNKIMVDADRGQTPGSYRQ